MTQLVDFDESLIRRYDSAGPRYTSYPTALQFHGGFDAGDYVAAAARSDTESRKRPLSLYFHIPFCDTVCFYCGCNKVVTKRREKAIPFVEHLCTEIALQGALFDRSRPVTQLHWGGGTPTFLSHTQMAAVMEAASRHFQLLERDQGEYSIEVDPREVREGTLPLLRSLGFNRLSMGVQDFDPRVQKAVNRIQPREVTFKVLDEARRLGFKSVNIDLIYGLPFQSVASFRETLDEVVAISPDRLSVFNYAHLPALFKPQRRIASGDLPSPAEKLEILRMTIERLNAAGYLYIGMDHFAKPDDELAVAQRDRTLYRNFQGYSTHSDCDLVALGPSSIGMVADVYSQNVKRLEDYYAALDERRLPIMRGVRLDRDDVIRRDVITRLICHFELDTQEITTRYGVVFSDYFAFSLQQLQSMESDGLVELGTVIRVTAKGRLLIRNICMTFDRYLDAVSAERFSRVI